MVNSGLKGLMMASRVKNLLIGHRTVYFYFHALGLGYLYML